jgi:hypothetical protein
MSDPYVIMNYASSRYVYEFNTRLSNITLVRQKNKDNSNLGYCVSIIGFRPPWLYDTTKDCSFGISENAYNQLRKEMKKQNGSVDVVDAGEEEEIILVDSNMEGMEI